MTATIATDKPLAELREALKLISEGEVRGWTLTTSSSGARSVSTPTGVIRIPGSLTDDDAAKALKRLNDKGFTQAATRPNRPAKVTKAKAARKPAATKRKEPEPVDNPYTVGYLAKFADQPREEQIAAIERQFYANVAAWEDALPLPAFDDGFVDRYVIITPEVAQQILDECADDSESPVKWNRKLSKPRANEYADAMQRGHWLLSSQGYSIDWDGHLRDGRTRLVACTIAGVPIPAKISYNQNPRDYQMYDGNRPRSGADTLYVGGDEYGVSNRHAATFTTARIIVAALRTDGGTGLVPPSLWPKKVPRDKVTALIASEPGVINQCVNDTAVLRTKPVQMLHPAAAAALYFARKAAPDGPHEEFIHAVAHGIDEDGNGLDADDPRFKLHRNLTRARRNKREADTKLHLALYLKTWNLFATNGTVDVLAWKPGEDLPAPVHM